MTLEIALKKVSYKAVVATVISAAIGLFAGKALLGSVVEVRGTSMAPTLAPGMFLHTERLQGGITRGDIVVLKDNDHETAIKRVVGLPGETVCIQHGYVFVNGVILIEPYIPVAEYTFPHDQRWVFVIGPSQCFVLGDNRSKSMDSRGYGPVELSQLQRNVPLPARQPRPHFGPWKIPLYDDLEKKLPGKLTEKDSKS
jgi:signal peptidase I